MYQLYIHIYQRINNICINVSMYQLWIDMYQCIDYISMHLLCIHIHVTMLCIKN